MHQILSQIQEIDSSIPSNLDFLRPQSENSFENSFSQFKFEPLSKYFSKVSMNSFQDSTINLNFLFQYFQAFYILSFHPSQILIKYLPNLFVLVLVNNKSSEFNKYENHFHLALNFFIEKTIKFISKQQIDTDISDLFSCVNSFPILTDTLLFFQFQVQSVMIPLLFKYSHNLERLFSILEHFFIIVSNLLIQNQKFKILFLDLSSDFIFNFGVILPTIFQDKTHMTQILSILNSFFEYCSFFNENIPKALEANYQPDIEHFFTQFIKQLSNILIDEPLIKGIFDDWKETNFTKPYSLHDESPIQDDIYSETFHSIAS
jgi:hypothetical protein